MAGIFNRTITKLIESGFPGEVIRDDDLKGFQARRNANGSVSYMVEYRAGRGRGFPVRRITLGKHGVLTPNQARSLAKSTLARVLSGHDPAAERANRRKEMTVADLLRHTLATHWQVKSKPSTVRNFSATIEHALIPEFGAIRISELTRSQIRGWHARQTHRRRQANLDLAILRKALNLAVSDEVIKANPALGVQLHPERRRDRVPTDDELAALLDAFDAASIRPQASLLFKLLLLTGCRTSEWRTAEWSWIDADGRTLRLPDAKAGARPVVLSSTVQALLGRAPRLSRFIVPGDDGEAPLSPAIVSRAWETVRTKAAIKDLRVHDLRHAFATRGAAMGASAVVLRDALGHKTMAMTGHYIARQNDAVRELSERISAQIQGIRSEGGDVLACKRPG
jgi:integrase